VELHDLRPILFGNCDRSIGALRIDHENFIGPADARQAARQIAGFILDWDNDRNRDAEAGSHFSVVQRWLFVRTLLFWLRPL
jgi:hypothetical protein